ncbi:MAG: hypothetical protein CVT80_10010 [Alphaproteobacteria bacterium HGW-Alphaproteobacteria-2]|nr:MAG: hypothetical protein CVT80_10010 [Alphaproteobacteria bacterium HGW-Alphaproteobacteria-2]
MAERPASAVPATEASGPVSEPSESVAETPEIERLVLTEALRIHPPEMDASEASAEKIEESREEAGERRLHLGAASRVTTVAGNDTSAQQTGYQEDGSAPDSAGMDENTVSAERAQPAPDDMAATDQATADDHDEQAEGDDTSADTSSEAEQMTQARAKSPEQEEREPEEILLAEAAEERILDEDTLREIVTQTVREELMGELGERITRNVKKLVRREIQRALAERAFD